MDKESLINISQFYFSRSFAFVVGFICTVQTKTDPCLGIKTHLFTELIQYNGWKSPWCLIFFKKINMTLLDFWKLYSRMNQTFRGSSSAVLSPPLLNGIVILVHVI